MYFDAHNDIWADVTNKRLQGHTDVIRKFHLDRFLKGKVEGGIFVMWVDPPYDRDHVARTRQIIPCVKAEMKECDGICFATSYADIEKARAEGVFYAISGMEGMAYLDGDIARLEDYYEVGARHGMLTWNESNCLGHGAVTGRTEGLTPLGKQVVRTMQSRGMMVDTSHLNDAGFWDIVSLATKPIMASHSNARALCEVPRNITDDMMRAVRDLNGVVGLNSYGVFVDSDPAKANVERLARHADHMIEVMGIDHVGCGFDFFEYLGNPDDPEVYSGDDSGCTGLEDCTKIDNLFAVFQKMGMTKEEMDKIAFGNFHRLMKECLD